MAPSALIIYEQFKPDDPFGRVMARNLQVRPLQMDVLALSWINGCISKRHSADQVLIQKLRKAFGRLG